MTKKKDDDFLKEKVKDISFALDAYQYYIVNHFNAFIINLAKSDGIDFSIQNAFVYLTNFSKEQAWLSTVIPFVSHMSTKEAGLIMEKTPTTIGNQIKDEKLRGIRVGKNWKAETSHVYEIVHGDYLKRTEQLYKKANHVSMTYHLWEYFTVRKLKLNVDGADPRVVMSKVSKANFNIRNIPTDVFKKQLNNKKLLERDLNFLIDYHHSRRNLNELFEFMYNKLGQL